MMNPESIDTFMAMLREQRSKYHVTLSELIKITKECPAPFYVALRDVDLPNVFEKDICLTATSYRGYYEDVALVRNEMKRMKVNELHSLLELTINETFEGYKGGNYRMEEDTPLWFTEHYSNTGKAVITAERDDANQRLVLVVKASD